MSDDRRELSDDPYYTLAQTGPYAAKIGSALITMVEPHLGHEAAYNRWYEDDHFNAGAMAFPWLFAGRRWVATVPYQKLRYPKDSAICLLYTSPSPRDGLLSRMPSSA